MAALTRPFSRPSVSVVTRSAVADRMLVVKVDSTVELPSEPDSGFAGSSSCVSNTSEHTGVCTIDWGVGVLTHRERERDLQLHFLDGPFSELHYVTRCEARKERRERAWSAWDGLLEGRLRGRPVGL